MRGGQAHPAPQWLCRSRAVPSTAAQHQHLHLSGGLSTTGCSKGPGSAFAADRQKHICDLFLVLTRIPCMKSFNFLFLFLKMRLILVLGSPMQRIGNFINAHKILQKTA